MYLSGISITKCPPASSFFVFLKVWVEENSAGIGAETLLLLMETSQCCATINNKHHNSSIKGLVHPKMKIKSLITHPHAVPTP